MATIFTISGLLVLGFCGLDSFNRAMTCRANTWYNLLVTVAGTISALCGALMFYAFWLGVLTIGLFWIGFVAYFVETIA